MVEAGSTVKGYRRESDSVGVLGSTFFFVYSDDLFHPLTDILGHNLAVL